MELVTVLGLVAAACTTIAFLPQAIKSIRTKHTKDISLPMYSIMTFGLVMWLVYGLIIGNLPLIFANAISGFFAGIILVLKIRHG